MFETGVRLKPVVFVGIITETKNNNHNKSPESCSRYTHCRYRYIGKSGIYKDMRAIASSAVIHAISYLFVYFLWVQIGNGASLFPTCLPKHESIMVYFYYFLLLQWPNYSAVIRQWPLRQQRREHKLRTLE